MIGHEVTPATLTLQDAAKMSGLSKSQLYLLARRNEIELVKCGARTLIRYDKLNAYLDRLPKAEFRLKASCI